MDMIKDGDNEGKRRDFEDKHTEFKSQLKIFLVNISTLIESHDLKSIYKDVAGGALDKFEDNLNFSPEKIELMSFLSREIKFYNDFFEKKKVTEWKPAKAASVILGSIGKFFSGTWIGISTDILQEILEISTYLHS